MRGLSFTEALLTISKLAAPVEKAGGIAGWLEHLGSFVVDVLEGRAVDSIVQATKSVHNAPLQLMRYADSYIGFDPTVEHPTGARGAHLFRFGTIRARDEFISDTGGDFTQRAELRKFDQDQVRDEIGRWVSEGAGGPDIDASTRAVNRAGVGSTKAYNELNRVAREGGTKEQIAAAKDELRRSTHVATEVLRIHLRAHDPSNPNLRKFDPDQPRDEAGKWTSGGGSDAGAALDPALDLNHDGHPVYKPLNEACVHMAKKIFPQGFDVTADAPNTFEDLVKHTAMTGRMAVWNGASDKTIFADDESNYAFRAWHDACHLRGLHPFTPEGEEGAFNEMVSDVRREYGDTPQAHSMVNLLHEEIMGQLEYTKFHGGQFPVDQRAFAEAYMHDPDGAVRMTFKFDSTSLEQQQAGWGRLRDVGSAARHGGPSLLSRLLAGRMNAALRKYDESELRDDQGRWTSGGAGPEAYASHEIAGALRQSIDDDTTWERMATELNADHSNSGGQGMSFASPSIHDKTLPEAVTDLSGPRHLLFQDAVKNVDDSLGIAGEQHGVVGAWKDGAENSTMLEIPGHQDYDAVRLSAAMKGYLGQQKQVLVFNTHRDGDHALYDMDIPGGKIEQVHEDLLKSGIPFHTLVPSASGTRAIVVDTDGSLGNNVGDFAVAHHTVATRSLGKAEFLGDEQGTGSDAEQRQRARDAYESVIQGSAASRYRGRAVGDIWKDIRDRWRSQLEAVKSFFLS